MTDDPLVLEVVVTREHVIAAEGSFRRILQRRAQAWRRRPDGSPSGGRRFAFRIVQVLAPIACLGSAALAATLLPSGEAPVRGVLWGVSAVVFGGLSYWFLAIGLRRTEAKVDAWHGRIADRTARDIVRKTLEIAPFRLTYTISGDAWRTVVDEPAQVVEFRRDDIGEIQTDDHVACLYKSRRSLRWKAVIWMVTDDVRQAFASFSG